MPFVNESVLFIENLEIPSAKLNRTVLVDCYLPVGIPDASELSLLLINDGQNMEELGLDAMLEEMFLSKTISPLLCVAVHANEDRRMEYGTAQPLDYEGRGAKAGAYTHFIFEELIPLVKTKFNIPSFKEKAFAGFSLGGLSALDIAWNRPGEFTKVAVFSGSLWWRTKGLDDGYNEDTDRIMHDLIRKGNHQPNLRFFFETGTQDETMDRNNNGIIDSIDDTLSLIDELVAKGYDRNRDIYYLELADGKHDVQTWARAMPIFLQWAFGASAY